jgi:hypothetical protein
MKWWSGHTTDAFSWENLLIFTRGAGRIEEKARTESVGCREKAEFGGWNGCAEKRRDKGVELAGMSIRRDLYANGYRSLRGEDVEIGGQRGRGVCWWGEVWDVGAGEVDFHGQGEDAGGGRGKCRDEIVAS